MTSFSVHLLFYYYENYNNPLSSNTAQGVDLGPTKHRNWLVTISFHLERETETERKRERDSERASEREREREKERERERERVYTRT